MQPNIASFIQDYQLDLINLLEKLPVEDIKQAIKVLEEAYAEDKQIFLCGNGGSAASSSHTAEDLAKGSMGPKADLPAKAVRAIALTDNTSYITAWANDTGYENIFVGQLKVLMNPKDVVIGISGSGNSPNVVNAVNFAKQKGNKTIAIVGFDGGELSKLADVVIHIQGNHYGRLEDAHMVIGHMIAYWFQSLAIAKHSSNTGL